MEGKSKEKLLELGYEWKAAVLFNVIFNSGELTISKCESPDFMLSGSQGRTIGLEVTLAIRKDEAIAGKLRDELMRIAQNVRRIKGYISNLEEVGGVRVRSRTLGAVSDVDIAERNVHITRGTDLTELKALINEAICNKNGKLPEYRRLSKNASNSSYVLWVFHDSVQPIQEWFIGEIALLPSIQNSLYDQVVIASLLDEPIVSLAPSAKGWTCIRKEIEKHDIEAARKMVTQYCSALPVFFWE